MFGKFYLFYFQCTQFTLSFSMFESPEYTLKTCPGVQSESEKFSTPQSMLFEFRYRVAISDSDSDSEFRIG